MPFLSISYASRPLHQRADDDGAGHAGGSGDAKTPGAAPPAAMPEPAMPRESEAVAAEPQTITVIAEVVQGERLNTGGVVRVRKQLRETQAEVDPELHEERVTVERVAVGRTLDAPVDVRQEGDVMIVPVIEERLEKRLVLIEELHIRRERRVRHEPRQVSLRREEVLVERLDPATGQWSPIDVPLRDTAEDAREASGSQTDG
jgi:hypothetical protein